MRTRAVLLFLGLAGLAAGCGSSHHTAASLPATTTAPTTTASGPTQGTGALQAEAQSTATGDIPDNQAFVVLKDTGAGYAIKYPEGWAQNGAAKRVVIRDKNNIVRVVVRQGPLPTTAAVSRELAALPGVTVSSPPAPHKLPSGPSVKVVYSTQSAQNPVTGKRVTLVVDRYYLAHNGKLAIVDLGTPQGVDNVDAYRLMIESFRWR
ncbi:MAG TPA: hypothetical protein VLK24_09355 [Gaiellaceae bacterium]|nr:hypothetical protein [Gaiellaceae bacterium]